MNEIELIRAQLTTERTHAAQVANACVAAFGGASPAGQAEQAFRDTSVSYLVWVLTRFEQRDQLLAEQVQRRLSAQGSSLEDTVPIELSELAARTGTSREALAKLEAALAADPPHALWSEFARFFNSVWCARRTAIERQMTHLAGAANWRAVCVVDADSILEERARHAAVAERVPPGITLIGSTAPPERP